MKNLACFLAAVVASPAVAFRGRWRGDNNLTAPYEASHHGERRLFSCATNQVEFKVWFGSVTKLDCKDNAATGKPDPYVKATINGVMKKTSTCDECKSWNQWLDFGCVPKSAPLLNLNIKDEDGGING